MAIEILTDQWPACFIKIDGVSTPADFESYIAAFNRFYERGEHFSVVSYLKRYTIDAEIVARVGTWFRDTEPLIRKHWVSNAMVSPSAGFRFVLGAVYLVKPLAIPNRVCANSQEALDFTRNNWSDARGWTGAPALKPLRWPF